MSKLCHPMFLDNVEGQPAGTSQYYDDYPVILSVAKDSVGFQQSQCQGIARILKQGASWISIFGHRAEVPSTLIFSSSPMAVTLFYAISFIFLISAILAAPVNENKHSNGVSAASSAQISSFITYIAFAHVSYCASEQKTWTCGNACWHGISDFVWHASGGNGGAFPHWFVGYSPSLGA